MFDTIPNEIIVLIFSFLETEELASVSLVCLLFKSLTKKTIEFLKMNYPMIHTIRTETEFFMRKMLMARHGNCHFSSYESFMFLRDRITMNNGTEPQYKPTVARHLYEKLYWNSFGWFENPNNYTSSLKLDVEINFHSPHYYRYNFEVDENMEVTEAEKFVFSRSKRDLMLNAFYTKKQWSFDFKPDLLFCRFFVKVHRNFGKTRVKIPKLLVSVIPKMMLLCMIFPGKLFDLISPFFTEVSYENVHICLDTEEEMFELREYFYTQSKVLLADACRILGQKAVRSLETIHKITCTDKNLQSFYHFEDSYDDHVVLPHRINFHQLFYCFKLTGKPPKKFLGELEKFCTIFVKVGEDVMLDEVV